MIADIEDYNKFCIAIDELNNRKRDLINLIYTSFLLKTINLSSYVYLRRTKSC